MKKELICFGILILFLIPVMISMISAAQINSASCSYEDVSAAINSASDGDTIRVPAGTCTWDNRIIFSKAISIIGEGKLTIINITGPSLYTINGHGTGNYRISSMKFIGTSTSGTDININGAWNSMRIDNIIWNTGSSRAIRIGYFTNGDNLFRGIQISHQKVLIDNIDYFPTISGAGRPFVLIYGRGYLAWQEEDGFGSDNYVFIENSTFNYSLSLGYITDTEFAGRFVFRYNQVFNAGVSMHDLGSTANSRGNRCVEAYNNNLTCNLSGCGSRVGFNTNRGGTGIFFNNNLTGYGLYTWPMIYRVVYNTSFIGGGYCKDTGARKVCQDMAKHCEGGTRDKRPCYDNSGCSGGVCGGYACKTNSDCLDYWGNEGLCMQLDGLGRSGIEAIGWPCRDQAGRGRDNPLTGEQETSPVYWWSNTVNEVKNKPMLVGGQYKEYYQENRDYCNHDPSINCGDKNAWNYVPYTYPHPLRLEDFEEIDPEEIIPDIPPTDISDIVTLQDMLGAYQQYKRNEVSLLYFLDKLKRWIVFW